MGAVLGVTLLLAAVPGACLLALLAAGSLAPAPTFAALAATLLGALVIALYWLADLSSLAATLRHAMLEHSDALAEAAAAPRLPPVERIARGIERLSRSLAARAAQVGDLLRANQAILERLPDPLLVLDADRAVRRANAAARTAFGADLPAVLRHPVLRAAIDAAWTSGGPTSVDLALAAPIPRDLVATVIVLNPTLADGTKALVVLSDRTRDRMVERMRADFAANASHELRTPLASLIGFIDTLRGPAADDPPAQQRFLAIMATQAERMNRLIDDLLSLSRIELTEHQPPADKVDLAALLTRLAPGFEPRLAARRVTLALDLAPNLPKVTADAEQLTQLASNLIDNAIKYGREAGTVRVTLARAETGLALTVADDGPGIPKAQVPRLTERFYRVDQGRSRAAGGTGLGLAIVKHITNRHRGRLTIDSDTGQGASFTVWLPLA